MDEQALLRRLTRKNANVERIAATVGRQPALLPGIFAGLAADRAAVRFGCLKVLRVVSERKPVVDFVKRQLRNRRPSTRKKAGGFVKKWLGE